MNLEASQETSVKSGWIGLALALVLTFLPGACSSVADYPYMKEGEPYSEGRRDDAAHEVPATAAVTVPRCCKR